MIKILCLLLVLSFLPSNVNASEFSIYDNAGLFSDDITTSLTNKNIEIKDLVDIEIMLMTIESLDNNTIEDYAEEIFTEYDVGSIRKNNGMLILISENDRQSVVLYGVGVEDIISSNKILEYQDLYLSNNIYDEAIMAFYGALYEEIDLYLDNKSLDNESVISINDFFVPILIASGLFLCYIAIVISNKSKEKKKNKVYKY